VVNVLAGRILLWCDTPGRRRRQKRPCWTGDLIAQLTHTFQMLLFLIYELPHQKKQRLDGLIRK
jgi:hypothetical protein